MTTEELATLVQNVLSARRWTVHRAAERTEINHQTLTHWVHGANLSNIARFHSFLEKSGYEVTVRKIPKERNRVG